jgi:hypothetical protein
VKNAIITGHVDWEFTENHKGHNVHEGPLIYNITENQEKKKPRIEFLGFLFCKGGPTVLSSLPAIRHEFEPLSNELSGLGTTVWSEVKGKYFL